MLIALVFIPVGLVLLSQSSAVVEYVKQYDGAGTSSLYSSCKITKTNQGWNDASGTPYTCTIDVVVDKDMDAPVFVYYQLDNFYQNHRR